MAYPPRKTLVENIDLTFHGLCSHITSDLGKFTKKQILKKMSGLQGMTVREINVLITVHYFDRPVSSADVAESIRFDPATVSRAAKMLVEIGMIQKADNESDSRSSLLTVTEKGASIARQYREISRQAVTAASAQAEAFLTPAEQQQFMDLLMKMRKRSKEFVALKPLDLSNTDRADNVHDITPHRNLKAQS